MGWWLQYPLCICMSYNCIEQEATIHGCFYSSIANFGTKAFINVHILLYSKLFYSLCDTFALTIVDIYFAYSNTTYYCFKKKICFCAKYIFILCHCYYFSFKVSYFVHMKKLNKGLDYTLTLHSIIWKETTVGFICGRTQNCICSHFILAAKVKIWLWYWLCLVFYV